MWVFGKKTFVFFFGNNSRTNESSWWICFLLFIFFFRWRVIRVIDIRRQCRMNDWLLCNITVRRQTVTSPPPPSIVSPFPPPRKKKTQNSLSSDSSICITLPIYFNYRRCQRSIRYRVRLSDSEWISTMDRVLQRYAFFSSRMFVHGSYPTDFARRSNLKRLQLCFPVEAEGAVFKSITRSPNIRKSYEVMKNGLKMSTSKWI